VLITTYVDNLSERFPRKSSSSKIVRITESLKTKKMNGVKMSLRGLKGGIRRKNAKRFREGKGTISQRRGQKLRKHFGKENK